MQNNLYKKNKVNIIAGPCSVEGNSQMEAVCKCLNDLGITWIRGGAYKPRTSPHMFQGLGDEAIDILCSCSKKYNLNCISEVVDEKSLNYAKDKLDAIQIGARNMTNFSFLKSCGQATKNTKMPVLFKRGMSAKISEWLCASDYISEAGNNNIIMCERGIRTFEDATRFTLDISAVPVLKKQSKYPVCIDVSHASGSAPLVPSMAQAALACGADAIMIEIHPKPHEAKSDGFQQLDLKEFENLLGNLRLIAKAMGKEIV